MIHTKKDPTRRRHHASKYYKKAETITDHVIDTENPNHETMKHLAADWWNSWHETTFIESLVKKFYYKPKLRRFDPLELLEGDEFETLKEKRENILKEEYYKLKKDIPQIHKMMPPMTFNVIFMYCIPNFLKPWLDDVKLDHRNRVTGKLELEILEIFENRKKVKLPELTYKLEEYFEAEVKASLTKMVKKRILEKLPLTEYKEQYYQILAKTDSKGFYIP